MKKLIPGLIGVMFFSMTAFAFTDVPEDDFYYDAITFLSEEGIVQGYSDGSYGVDKSINRAEMLKIVVEAKYLDEGGTVWMDQYGTDSCFKDVSADQWYTKYVCYAKAQKWIQGYGDGTFKPAQNINFVEALKIVLEVLDVSYGGSVDPWYKGMVEGASDINIIPLSISDFGQIINRAEMADLIARKIMLDAGMLEDFLDDKIDYIVTYETISAGVDMSELWDMPCQTCDNSPVTRDLLLDEVCSPTYNVIAGIYTGFTCDNREFDFEENLEFQVLFPDSLIYLGGNGAVLVGDNLYFSTFEIGGDVSVYNRLIEFNTVTDESRILYAEEDLGGLEMMFWGVDLFNDVLVVSMENTNNFPLCWSPWVDAELFAADIYGEGEGLVEYTSPAWKVNEEQAEVDDCRDNM